MRPSPHSFARGLLLGLGLGMVLLMIPKESSQGGSLTLLPVQSSSVERWSRITRGPSSRDGGLGTTTSFLNDPTHFLQILQNCEQDESCRLFYHHAHKTGGTTMEFFMDEHFGLEHHKTCCGETRVSKFYRHRDDFCRLKFQAHQVSATSFFELVEECAEVWPAETGLFPPESSPLVILSTFRNPIEMMISQVNQLCNKNPEKRSDRIRQACQACSFDQYTEVWLDVVDMVTQELQHVLDVLTWRTTVAGAAHQRGRLHLLALDVSDLDDFWQQWQPQLWKQANMTRFNPEFATTCQFAAPSDLLREMGKAQSIYRQLVLL